MEHSKLPWVKKFQFHIMTEDMSGMVAICKYENDAAFIVKAVNNHDKLVEALKDIRNFCTGTTQPEGRIDECLRVANNALKDVEGE